MSILTVLILFNAIVFHNLSISYKWYDTHTWWIQECVHFKSLTRL